jgi:hypothetical protein
MVTKTMGTGVASAAPDFEHPEGTLLFDLDNDIDETTNLAADQPDLVREMTQSYEQGKAQMIESQQHEKKGN